MSHLDDAVIIRRWAEVGVEVLRSHRAELNALNVFPVPDGDTGTNLYLTFRAAAEAEVARTGAPDDARDALNSMARGALLGARGNSGVILAQVLQAVAQSVAATSGGLNFKHIMVTVAQAARSAVADPQEGTALTVLDAAAAALANEPSVAASAARESLERTTDMLPILRAAGVVDAGGRGAVLLLDALNAIWHGAEFDSPSVGFVPDAAPHAAACDADAAYEVMFVVATSRADEVVGAIENHGVSLVVTRGEELTHIHLHADAPELVLARASAITDVRHVRMESLTATPRTRSLVAQAFGSGIVRMLVDAGVTIVPCEPDARASVQDFVSAALKSGAREVIVLPGDKDSLSVASIAAEELKREGIRAVVVPTQFITETLAAVSVADMDSDIEKLLRSLTQASEVVTTLTVSVASRDSQTPVGAISTGDFLGFINGDIRASASSLEGAVEAVVGAVTDAQLITVIVGSHVSESERRSVLELLEQSFESAEFYIVEGHQDVWRLMVGFE